MTEHREPRPTNETEWTAHLKDQDDRVVTARGPVIRSINRFKRLVGVVLVVLALGNAFVLKAIQEEQRKDCVTLRARSTASFQALSKLRDAAKADGDDEQAMVWQEYLDAAKKNPLPTCR